MTTFFQVAAVDHALRLALAHHEAHEAVTVEMVVANLAKNSATAQEIIRLAAAALDPEADCTCRHALASAIMTQPKAMPPATRKKLRLLLQKYAPKK